MKAAFSFDALFERVVVSKLLQSNPAQGLQASEVAAAIHKGEAAGRRKYTAKYSGFYLWTWYLWFRRNEIGHWMTQNSEFISPNFTSQSFSLWSSSIIYLLFLLPSSSKLTYIQHGKAIQDIQQHYSPISLLISLASRETPLLPLPNPCYAHIYAFCLNCC